MEGYKVFILCALLFALGAVLGQWSVPQRPKETVQYCQIRQVSPPENGEFLLRCKTP